MSIYLIEVRPKGQTLPTFYAARRYNRHHGGRLVNVKRQALAWTTRRAAERWIAEELVSKRELHYGELEYTIIRDGQVEHLPEEYETFVFLDHNDERVEIPGTMADLTVAHEIARQNGLKLYKVKYRIAEHTLLGDYRNGKGST